MDWTSLDTWIVITGVLSAMSCALVGNFLVLRKMSMMGDAISHAVLPGLAIAFLISSSRGSITMFIGAAIAGLITALFTQWIHKFGKVEESAAMGVTFTALFAIGLILIVRGADKVDLDPGCVLYGAIELVPLDTITFLSLTLPRAVWILGSVMLINILFTLVLYKELRLTCFDPALATTLGINANVMHYVTMTLVAITTVASFESVGSILVIAMLIVPASAAHLLTNRYGLMLAMSMIFAAVSAVLGHISAITVPTWLGFADTSTAGMIAVVAGLLFTCTMFFAPHQGILSKVWHRLRLSLRIASEDILGKLYRLEESTSDQPTLAQSAVFPANKWISRLARADLARTRKITRENNTYRLTEQGRFLAMQLVRSHRLWETYVAKHFDLEVDHLHDSAERTEHYITQTMQQDMIEELSHVKTDPHGKKIPDQPSSEDSIVDPKQKGGQA